MQYWANRALDVLRQQIVLANVVAQDTNFGEVGWRGKSITVPYPGTFTAVQKAADTAMTPQAPSGGSSVTLTLSNHRVVPFLVEDFAAAQTNMSLMDRYIQPATIALAEQFELDLMMTSLQAGTIANLGTATTDLTAAVARSAMTKLNSAKAPVSDRALVLSPKDQAALLGDTSLQSFFAFSQADAVRNGFFGRLYGFDCYWTQIAPLCYTVTQSSASTYTFNSQTTSSVASGAGNTAAVLQAALAGLSSVGAGNVSVSGPAGGPFVVAFTPTIQATGTLSASTATVAAGQANLALHKNAVMYATRPFPVTPASAGVQTATANDPESGLSIRISSQYDIEVGVAYA